MCAVSRASSQLCSKLHAGTWPLSVVARPKDNWPMPWLAPAWRPFLMRRNIESEPVREVAQVPTKKRQHPQPELMPTSVTNANHGRHWIYRRVSLAFRRATYECGQDYQSAPCTGFCSATLSRAPRPTAQKSCSEGYGRNRAMVVKQEIVQKCRSAGLSSGSACSLSSDTSSPNIQQISLYYLTA
jgi:hypothetical protein